MTNTKLTYVATINAILTAINDQSFEGITAEHVEKLIALGQSLEKRNATKSTKPTKKQVENADTKQKILDTLLVDEGKQCKAIAEELGISTQKCSALLSQLVADGEVTKTLGEKRVTLFTKAVVGE